MGYRRDNRMWQAGYDYYQNFVHDEPALADEARAFKRGYDEGFDAGAAFVTNAETWQEKHGGRVTVTAAVSHCKSTLPDPDYTPWRLTWGPQPHNPGRPVAVVRTPGPGDPPPAKPGDVVTFTLRQTAVESDHHFTD